MRKSTICLALVMLVTVSAIWAVPAASLEPPPMVQFEDQQELEALIAAAALPDDELEEYLAEQGYDWNRMGSRSELDRFLEPFRLLGYPDAPIADPAEDFGMTYYPSYGYSDFIYKIDGIRYRFLVQMDGEVIDRSGMEKVGTYAIEDQEFVLYVSTNGDALVGEVYYEHLRIRIIVQYYEHIEDVSFEPFFWHKVETNPVKESERFPYEIAAICVVAAAAAGAVAVVIRKKKCAAE